MISIDNAVELAIKTYLGLPKRIRGYEGPTRKRIDSLQMKVGREYLNYHMEQLTTVRKILDDYFKLL